jgi:hypothetical protein
MPLGDILFVALVVAGFTFYGAVLAWGAWQTRP